MYTGKQSRTRASNDDHHRALFKAGFGGHERSTHEPRLLRSSSLYVKATKRPIVTGAVVLGGGALAFAMLRSGKGGKTVKPPLAGDIAEIGHEPRISVAAE